MELQWRQKLLKERFDAINRSIAATRAATAGQVTIKPKDTYKELTMEQLKCLRGVLKHRHSLSQDYAKSLPNPSPNSLFFRYMRLLEQTNRQLRETVTHLRAEGGFLLEENCRLTAAAAKDQAIIAEFRRAGLESSRRTV